MEPGNPSATLSICLLPLFPQNCAHLEATACTLSFAGMRRGKGREALWLACQSIPNRRRFKKFLSSVTLNLLFLSLGDMPRAAADSAWAQFCCHSLNPKLLVPGLWWGVCPHREGRDSTLARTGFALGASEALVFLCEL